MAEFDPSRAKPETVLRLCTHDSLGKLPDTQVLLQQLRSECRIRNRTEIAIDLVTKLGRSAYGGGPDSSRQLVFNIPDGVSVNELLDLLLEFGRAKDSGPSSVDAIAGDDHPPVSIPVSPAGAAFQQSWCGSYCETPWNCFHARRCLKPNACTQYGPPGAAAAKESSDTTAAAPAGAALDDVEACGCEETEALRGRIVEFCRLFNAMHDLARQMFDLTQVGP